MKFVEIPDLYYIENLSDLDLDIRNEFLAKAYIPANTGFRACVA